MTRRRPLCALALAAACSAAATAPALAQRGNVARQIRDNQERLEAIRQERTALERELDRLRGRLHDLTSEIQNIEQQRHVTGRMVNELDRQIGLLNAQVDTVTMDFLLAQDALAEKRAVLERRLVEIYKRGALYPFQVLLAAESFGDLLSRYKYLHLVSRQDRALVSEVEELRDRVARQRRQLVNIRGELGRRRDDRTQELERWATLERRRQQALREARASQRATTTRLDVLARDEERLASVLAELERERRRAVARGEASVGDATITDRDQLSLEWPLDGRVLYRFGRASGPDDTHITYNGIGIAAPSGTPVKAVAAGMVERASLYGTYGPSIILNHGGGFYTLYLYLSDFTVEPGQWVVGGDVVGHSGGAGSDQGPHIEFQIRQVREANQAIALDPENWLKKRR